jgi:pSer/pThr/pTyr-binding forkhead associated (FHA) protein
MDLDPIAVALKFGFLAVLYLFLLWVTRSVLRDLRSTGGITAPAAVREPEPSAEPALIVERGGGLKKGQRFDLFGGATIGRSADAEIRVSDRYASQMHARLYTRKGVQFVEDLKSTNGTLLNDDPLEGEAELRPGDVIRIGDTEFVYEE